MLRAQGLAQKLVNLNMWMHNLNLTLAQIAQALAQYLVNLNVWTHNILTLVARRRAGVSASGGSLCNVRTACDHARAPWAAVSTGVVAYSCAVALTLPFFSTLVGLMSSVTYLTCAYTLPVRGGP